MQFGNVENMGSQLAGSTELLPSLPETLEGYIDRLAHAPTPSCIAFQRSFHVGVVLPAVSLRMQEGDREIIGSIHGKKGNERVEDLRGLPLCGRCLDMDAWPPRDAASISLSPLWLWERSGHVSVWKIFAGGCSECGGYSPFG